MDVSAIVAKVSASINEANRPTLEEIGRIDFAEHFAYQTAQSIAHASGMIPLETALYLYQTLGDSAESFNRQPLADRLVCLSILGQIAKG